VLGKKVWARLLGVDKAVIEGVVYDEETDAVVASVRPARGQRLRCGVCLRRSARYDAGEGRRRWRTLDLGGLRAYLEADAPRVSCPQHGVVVAHVPWARHGAGHTRSFDDQVAWLAVHTSRTAVTEVMRIAWRTVGAICARVAAERRAAVDPLANLRRIGIDEISYKRGHRYITIVVDHDTGRLVWARPGHDEPTLVAFFELLGPERCRRIAFVSCDQAGWIDRIVAGYCPGATRCADPFHVVRWATDALDEVRRQTWNAARRCGLVRDAKQLKRARYALWKAAENLTPRQRGHLAQIQRTNRTLYRAYLLKEQLREVFRHRGTAALRLLEAWLSWARRCRIPSFIELAKRIARHRAQIEATLVHGLSNALVESVNTRIRLLTRLAFGFRDPGALIGLAMLKLGGYCPPLPGRPSPTHG
jgi:transposase